LILASCLFGLLNDMFFILYWVRRNHPAVCDGKAVFLYAGEVSHPTLNTRAGMGHAETSPALRKHLRSLAYGYLGSLVESDDIVQEAFLRYEQSDQAAVQNVEAWLTTVVTRLSIDTLRSARHRREIYPGEWLPEPVFNAPTSEQDAITRSHLSIALLYLLEKLEPEQRAVFVLREVFDHSYQSIAELVGKSEAASRQLMVRARAALDRAKLSPPAPTAIAASLVSRFIEALSHGEERELLEIIAPDAMLVGDGGGKVPSILKPMYGADRISHFFLALMRRPESVFEMRPATVNSAPGMLAIRDGQLVSVRDGRIAAIYAVNNPDKIHT
jgi:RNA polymerase sigma-70 factor (ECF subfamily)